MSSTLDATMDMSRRFLSWWRGELADLVPTALRRWAAGEGTRRTILAVDGGGFVRYTEGRGGIDRRSGIALDAADGFAGAAVKRKGRLVGLRLPRSVCLFRRLELPANARKDFNRILRLDLERATPFRQQEIYSDHVVEDRLDAEGTVRVCQVVVKRDVLDPLLEQLSANGIKIDFVDCWDESGQGGVPVNLLKDAAAAASRGRSGPILWLGLCVLVLSCSAVLIGFSRYDAAIERLEAETAAAKVKALAVKRSLAGGEAFLAQIAELRRVKTTKPTVIRVLDELTRLLPDTAWVNSLKIEGDAVQVTIIGKTTGDLLPLLDRSSLFTVGGFNAPVTYDPVGQSERATVRMTLRPEAAPVRSPRAPEGKS
jgi:general secretion pathway protein L